MMKIQELTFQYWQDATGTWQWQLMSHIRPAPDGDPAEAPDFSPRVLASGHPCSSETEALAEIDLVKSCSGAGVVHQSP